MTETAKGSGTGIIADFMALTTKQWIGIIAAMAVALILEIFMGSTCMGFFVVAVLLYMIPHMLGVSSVKVKTVVGVVFAVAAISLGTFAFGGTIEYLEDAKNTSDDSKIQDIVYDEENNYLTFTLIDEELLPGTEESPRKWHARAQSIPVDGIAFGKPNRAGGESKMYLETSDPKYKADDEATKDLIVTATYVGQDAATGKYTWKCEVKDFKLDDGKLYLIGVGVGEGDKITKSVGFAVDKGCDKTMIYFKGTAYTVAFALVIYFMILIFSTVMRRSAEKSRKKMEAEGRLYPQGYGRCKKCGAMVLPGEINCRKCGTYIDVPEELRAKKKDFFQCTECGAEVPSDADVCPKCGAKFEGSETEIVHEDGSVEVTEDDSNICPGCNNPVPPGAEWCPRCGHMMKKE